MEHRVAGARAAATSGRSARSGQAAELVRSSVTVRYGQEEVPSTMAGDITEIDVGHRLVAWERVDESAGHSMARLGRFAPGLAVSRHVEWVRSSPLLGRAYEQFESTT